MCKTLSPTLTRFILVRRAAFLEAVGEALEGSVVFPGPLGHEAWGPRPQLHPRALRQPPTPLEVVTYHGHEFASACEPGARASRLASCTPAVHSVKDKRPLLQALGTGAVDTLSSVWSCAHALQALELGFFRR